MTLGGLALAVGILVDDATVAIENTYRLFEEGEEFRESVVDGAAGIAKPALISTLAICAAFTAVFALTDTPKYLFTPQALAVVFAMLTSYLLSRTLVPLLIDVIVAPEYRQKHAKTPGAQGRARDARRPAPGPHRPGCRPRRRTAPAARRAPPWRLRARLRAVPPGLCRPAARGAAPPDRHPGRRRRRARHDRRAVRLRRPGLLPADRGEPDDHASAHAHRHADRDHPAGLRAGRGHGPRGDPARTRSSRSSRTSACRRTTTTSRSRTARSSPTTTARC